MYCKESVIMSTNSLYFYTDKFALYDFGPGHPFSPLRQTVTHSLIKACGLLPNEQYVSNIAPAADDTIQLIHTARYIDIVKMANQADGRFPPLAGIGQGDNPPFLNMHEAAAYRVAATVAAAEAVMDGRTQHALNIGGGLHHAQTSEASGFCVYNDIAIAIEHIRREYDCRVAYIDIDAHHGDGVQNAFYTSGDVLTISLHETGRTLFPGTGDIHEIGEDTGFGRSINIPFEPGTTDASWLTCFKMIVPKILRLFSPDIIVSQHGADAHADDPLTHLQLSTQALHEATSVIHQLAHELCEGRWVALGGGGYALWNVVPRAWMALWATVSHQDIPNTLPERWRTQWQSECNEPLPKQTFDEHVADEDENVYERNVNNARQLINLVRPTF